MSTAATTHDARIDAVRRFNRFYTRRIGVLEERLLSSAHSLTEVRVLYELGHVPAAARGASSVAAALGIDAGYLSRILRSFERRALVRRRPAPKDGRRRLLALTTRGRTVLARLEKRSRAEVEAMLRPLDASEQRRLVEAMRDIERMLEQTPPTHAAIVLRPPEPGDIGWVIHRHGALYAREHGYDAEFESLVAQIAAAFLRKFDPSRERCWIAERDGRIVGSVFLVRKSARVAKLRLLLVEPSARGLGLGTRLVDECVRFARRAGYRSIVLWTQSELAAARRIYERSGFRLIARQSHRSFGRDLVAETWQLDL